VVVLVVVGGSVVVVGMVVDGTVVVVVGVFGPGLQAVKIKPRIIIVLSFMSYSSKYLKSPIVYITDKKKNHPITRWFYRRLYCINYQHPVPFHALRPKLLICQYATAS